MDECIKCGRKLTYDEIGLHRKLFNRAAEKYMCIDCCSDYLEVPVSLLKDKISYFKEIGCTLFK